MRHDAVAPTELADLVVLEAIELLGAQASARMIALQLATTASAVEVAILETIDQTFALRVARRLTINGMVAAQWSPGEGAGHPLPGTERVWTMTDRGEAYLDLLRERVSPCRGDAPGATPRR